MDITAQQITDIIVAISILATAIAAITPTDQDDKIVGRIKNLLNKILRRTVTGSKTKPAKDKKKSN